MKPIMCYKCNRQADKATYYCYFEDGTRCIRVECHGDVETFSISEARLVSAETEILLPDYAFVPLQPMLTKT